jgi:hypothetical protein
MKALLLLGVILATPAMAQAPDERSVTEASRLALEACVEHASAVRPIEGKSGKELDAKGLRYQLNPPEFLASTRMTTLGLGQYLKSPSNAGEIWAIGYDSSACMVVTLGASVDEAAKGYADYFTQAKSWRQEKSAGTPRPGEQLQKYSWNPRRNLQLTAIISLRSEANTSTVTITRINR